MMYKLCFNVPYTHVEEVKNAIFDAGAGAVDHYTRCSWQILGEGQFMPLEGSNPFIGDMNQLEKVAEYKVETICRAECIQAVIAALKNAHPYECPSCDVIKLEHF